MSISISESRDLSVSVDTCQEISLRSSLQTFAEQFGLKGCSIWQFYLDWQRACQVECSSGSPDAMPTLRSESDWQALSHVPLFEIALLKDHEHSDSVQLYACLYHRSPKSYDYLLCWHDKPLSEHQLYGISLYTQALRQQRTETVSEPNPMSQKLQHIRHQLRTPLALITLYVDMLRAAILDSRAQEWLKNLHHTTEEMHTSLNHLTETAIAQEQPLSSYDVRQLLAQCDQVMQPWLKEKQLQLICEGQPLKLRVDAWKIKQVFQNLLSNAIAFSPPGGQITCEWQIFQSEVLIKVRDEGPGLSVEDLRSWGTPFYSRRPGGTGLGLAIAKQIILEHRGSLWAENLPGGGAQFCIVLPQTS